MNNYLAETDIIDWKHPTILQKAEELKSKDLYETIINCFNFVRDEIPHIFDYQLNPVTLKASEVLKYKTGYCYSKSHLLAALLRANSIKTGFTYQRLKFGKTYSLHGLNVIFLEEHGWIRLDCSGLKCGNYTKFNPPKENLAFIPKEVGEIDLPEICCDPMPMVIDFLRKYKDREESLKYIPDIEI